jgi:DNA polymerase-1
VDVDRLRALEAEWTAAREEMTRDLEGWAADLGFQNPPKRKRDEPFNPASPQQLARILFGADFLGLRPRVRSAKTGAPSTAEAVLKDLIDELLLGDPESDGARFLRLLIRSRKYANTLKYLPILRENLRPDGRVHPTFLPLVTGRYSAVDPPMQTFTQPYKLEADGVPELAALRSVIIPSEGMVLIARDYDQLEIHVGAWLSGDEQMKADLKEPFPESGLPDYHSRVCRDVLGCKAEYRSAEWERTRRGAKVFTFGIEYGEGAKGLAHHAAKETGARFTERRAQEIITAWYTRYATFKEWQRDQIRQARRHGYIENPFGFVRRFPFPDSAFETQMVNCNIQGTASQHGTVAMVELVGGERYWTRESYAAGFPTPSEAAAGHELSRIGGHVLLTIHDEILAEVPEDRIEEGQALLQAAMEHPRVPGWPGMLTQPSQGLNWREMAKG